MEMIEELRKIFGDALIAAEPAGSRVTCTPAPTDTDEDYILHVRDVPLIDAVLTGSGWELGGSRIPADAKYTAPEECFASYTRDHVNLIITESEPFYVRFVAATHVAKRLNLLNNPDRIALFQAVLYGAKWVEAS